MTSLHRATSPRARCALLGALALLAGAAPGSALANGRFPAAQHVVIGPGSSERRIVLRATFGFLVSEDAGHEFRYVCEDALGIGSQEFDPAIAVDRTGRLHVGLPTGLARVSVDRCSTERNPLADQQTVTDLDNSPDGVTVVAVAAPGFPGSRNRVLRSDDAGETFRALGDGVAGVAFDTLELAPTDLQRVYLSGLTYSPRRVVVFRSDDGGATLRDMAFPDDGSFAALFIAGVDPARADTLFARAVLNRSTQDASSTGGTALLRSTDGGTTWSQVARTVGPMLGFAISDDGRTIWYGGSDAADGLFRSTDGGQRFERVASAHVACLRQHGGVLYVCGDDAADGYALGRSSDGGGTITPLLRFAEVPGPYSCAALADGALPVESSVCATRWQMLRSQYFTRDAGVDLPTPDGNPVDGAAPGTLRPAPLLGGGCRCQTSALSACSRRGAPLAWALSACAVALRRRRRPARR